MSNYNPYFSEKYNDKVLNKKPIKKKRKKSIYRNPYFDAMNRVLVGENDRMKKKEVLP